MRAAGGVVCALLALLLGGCEDCSRCAPQTAPPAEPDGGWTGCDPQNTLRGTNSPGASTQPALATVDRGYVLAWLEDGDEGPVIQVQGFDPLGTPVRSPTELRTGSSPRRPRLATSGEDVAVAYTDDGAEGGQTSVYLQVLDMRLEPLLDEPVRLSEILPPYGADIAHDAGAYVVAIPGPGSLTLVTARVVRSAPPRDAGGGTGDAGMAGNDDGGTPAGVRAETRSRTIPVEVGVDGEVVLGNVDLLFQGGALYLATDGPDGSTIQVAEVGQERLRRLSRIIDDSRHPDSRWCCPALGPIGERNLGVVWEGPSRGMTSLHYLGLSPSGEPFGRVRLFEAIVRDEERDERIGQAPAFHPAVTVAPYGMLLAFADNRYANSEILLVPLTCRE